MTGSVQHTSASRDGQTRFGRTWTAGPEGAKRAPGRPAAARCQLPRKAIRCGQAFPRAASVGIIAGMEKAAVGWSRAEGGRPGLELDVKRSSQTFPARRPASPKGDQEAHGTGASARIRSLRAGPRARMRSPLVRQSRRADAADDGVALRRGGGEAEGPGRRETARETRGRHLPCTAEAAAWAAAEPHSLGRLTKWTTNSTSCCGETGSCSPTRPGPIAKGSTSGRPSPSRRC
jgi:hypothetical protein